MADTINDSTVKPADGTGTIQTSPPVQKAAEAPAEYKIIKVRKPDGTIIRVKRPIAAAGSSSTAKVTTAPLMKSAPPAIPNGETVAKIVSAPATKTAIQDLNGQPKSGATISSAALSGKPAFEPSEASADLSTKPAAKPVDVPTSRSPPRQSADTTASTTTTQQATATSIPSKSSTPLPPAYEERAPVANAAVYPATNTKANTTTAVQLEQEAPRRGFLARIGRHTAQVANAFVPQLEIGDLELGDVELPSDNSDDDSDTDREDNRRNNKQGDLKSGGEGPGAGHAETTAATNMLSTVGQGAAQGQQEEGRRIVGNGQTVRMDDKKKQLDKPLQRDQADEKAPFVEATEAKPSGSQRAARKLRRRNPTDPSRIVIWTIMVLLPLLFILLGILVAVANGRSVESSKLGAGVSQALKVGVSAWPIIFAAVAAQSLRALATWKVERGVQLMTLEQLISSNSVASSFKQPFILRRFDWVTAALFALWSLSPLAGQAMVRVQYIDSSTTTSNVQIPYIDTTKWVVGLGVDLINKFAYDQTQVDLDHDWTTAVRRLYPMAFLPTSPNNVETMDTWNNPMVPIFEEQSGSPDTDRWVSVTRGRNTNYTSFLGLPLLQVDKASNATNTTLSLNTVVAYLELDCLPMKRTTLAEINATLTAENPPLVKNGGLATRTTSLYVSIDRMGADKAGNIKGDLPGNIRFASLIEIENGDLNDPRPYDPETGHVDLYAYTVCSYRQVFVEVGMSCSPPICVAEKMRTAAPSNYSIAQSSELTTQLFMTSQMATLGRTDTETYIMSPESMSRAGIVAYNEKDRFNLMTVPHDLFTQRLSKLFNTFWQAATATEFISRPLTWSDIVVPNVNMMGVPYATNSTNPLRVTTATRTDTYPTYATSWVWLAVLLFSSVILLAAGIAAVIWDRRTIIPDILGFASSVARKSRYVDLPKMDLTMSGAERARQLQDVKVMMQDVKPNAPVGRVALGTYHKGAERLKPERMYR